MDLQENWDESIKDRLQYYTASVVGTLTVIWAANVGAGTKRRILSITVSNESTSTPTKAILQHKLAGGTFENVWYKRTIPGAGYVQDQSPSWKEPLLSIEPGGNLMAGVETAHDGYIEVIFYDDHLGL